MANAWKLEQFIEMLLGVTGVALGLSFMMKSGLGQTALTAFLQCISLISGMKSGTLLMCFYLLCVLLQLLIQRKDFDKLQVLQLPVCWIQGIIINLTCYDIAFLADIRPVSYPMQWVFLAVGIILVSFGVALTMAADLVKQPFEQLIVVISKKYKKPFNFLRCGADACCCVFPGFYNAARRYLDQYACFGEYHGCLLSSHAEMLYLLPTKE